MKTRIIILVIKRHVGEIDWILPILYRLNKKFTIVTIFQNQASFESCKTNKNIYSIWMKICTKYFVLKKYENLVWKFTFKFFLYFKLNKFTILRKLENFILFNVFNIPKLMKKKKININYIYYVFTANSNSSYLPNYIKKENTKINIVRFPEATMLSPTKKENPFFELTKKKNAQYFRGFFFILLSIRRQFFFWN